MNRLKKSKIRAKRKTLSITEKISVIRDHAKGHSYKKMAEMYSCSKTQIQKIISSKEECWAKFYSFEKESIKRQARMVILEAAVDEWIQRSCENGHVIDDDKINDVSLQISQVIHLDDFKPNNLWLQFFKKKFNIESFAPFPTKDVFNVSLNIVDILIDMMEAKSDFGFPLLCEHIAEQLEISCASMLYTTSSNTDANFENQERAIITEIAGDLRTENDQSCDLDKYGIELSANALQNLCEFPTNSGKVIKTEDTYDKNIENYSLQKTDIVDLELVQGFIINENIERNNNVAGSQDSVVLDLKEDEAGLQKTNTIALELIENFDINEYREEYNKFGLQSDTSMVVDFNEDEADTIKIEVLFDECDDDKERVLENGLRQSQCDSYIKTTDDILVVKQEIKDQTKEDKSHLECPVTKAECDDCHKDLYNMNNVESKDTRTSEIVGVQGGNEISIINNAKLKPIISYRDAMRRLGPLENFVSNQKNIRATTIINQLEKIFKERVKLNE